MLSISIAEVDRVKFIQNICILGHDDKVNGVPVHRIPSRYLDNELRRAIKALGMRKVDFDYRWDAEIYVVSDLLAWRFKIANFALKVYWGAIKWLYDNARFFKMIPQGEQFSWQYFTPYCWWENLARKNLRR
mgnify:FL=1